MIDVEPRLDLRLILDVVEQLIALKFLLGLSSSELYHTLSQLWILIAQFFQGFLLEKEVDQANLNTNVEGMSAAGQEVVSPKDGALG